MEGRLLLKTTNFERHDFSLLLVDRKPALLEWLHDYQRGKGLEGFRLDSPKGRLAVIIPKIDRFNSHESLEIFLDRVKPRLLRSSHRYISTAKILVDR